MTFCVYIGVISLRPRELNKRLKPSNRLGIIYNIIKKFVFVYFANKLVNSCNVLQISKW